MYIHRLPASAVQTAASAQAKTVRVQIITPPGAISREGQRQLVRQIAELMNGISLDAQLGSKTWMILTEAAEGGWGMLGTAFGKEGNSLRSPQKPKRRGQVDQKREAPTESFDHKKPPDSPRFAS